MLIHNHDLQNALPNRADNSTLVDLFGDGECLLELSIGMCCDWLLDEHRNAGEVLQNLQLNVAPRLSASTEHGRRTNDECVRPFGLWPALDILGEIFVNAGVLVC